MNRKSSSLASNLMKKRSRVAVNHDNDKHVVEFEEDVRTMLNRLLRESHDLKQARNSVIQGGKIQKFFQEDIYEIAREAELDTVRS